jgi:hypothetical protein
VELIVPEVAPGELAVAESDIVSVEFEAFDATVAVPDTLPADSGMKVMVRLVLCPAVKVNGKAILLMLNPVPVAEA